MVNTIECLAKIQEQRNTTLPGSICLHRYCMKCKMAWVEDSISLFLYTSIVKCPFGLRCTRMWPTHPHIYVHSATSRYVVLECSQHTRIYTSTVQRPYALHLDVANTPAYIRPQCNVPIRCIWMWPTHPMLAVIGRHRDLLISYITHWVWSELIQSRPTSVSAGVCSHPSATYRGVALWTYISMCVGHIHGSTSLYVALGCAQHPHWHSWALIESILITLCLWCMR